MKSGLSTQVTLITSIWLCGHCYSDRYVLMVGGFLASQDISHVPNLHLRLRKYYLAHRDPCGLSPIGDPWVSQTSQEEVCESAVDPQSL